MAPIRSQRNSARVTPAMRQSIRAILNTNQEHKVATFATPSGANWTIVGSVTEVTRTIIQGGQIFQRSGDMIIVKDLKIHMETLSTGAGNATSYRVILFADGTNNGAVPAVTDVLDVADFRAAYQNFNLQRKRFKVFYDKTYVNVSGTTTQNRFIEIHIPRMHHKVYYNGSAAAVTDNGKGAIFMLVIASTIGSGQFSYLPQITYTDS